MQSSRDATAGRGLSGSAAGIAAACLGLLFAGSLNVLPVQAAERARTLSLYNIHTKETLTVTFKRNGQFEDKALEQINWHLRDWRQDESITIDPALIDLVWAIHRELGSRKPVHVISGYRSPATNKMLRKKRGGQARRSLHLKGRAMDVRFPDVPVRRLRYSALLREQGGVGYYPTSATPFVHIDTGRIRHWPRMARTELALLFPDARTRHRPARGGPLTPADVRAARRSHPALARQIALFRTDRQKGVPADIANRRFAAASPKPKTAPKLIAPPRLARPRLASIGSGGWQYTFKPTPPKPQPALTSAPSLAYQPEAAPRPQISNRDRGRLAQLAATLLSPVTEPAHMVDRIKRPLAIPASPPETAGTWIQAPAYDDEHPEELFYRPFPIAPFITLTASADDRALRRLVAPDTNETLALLVDDQESPDPPLQLRPGLRQTGLLWAQAFRSARHAAILIEKRSPEAFRPTLANRRVRLAGRPALPGK